MPLFKCSKCGCCENTALSNYWWTVFQEKKPPLCSECDPEIGKWHEHFTKRPFTEEDKKYSGMTDITPNKE